MRRNWIIAEFTYDDLIAVYIVDVSQVRGNLKQIDNSRLDVTYEYYPNDVDVFIFQYSVDLFMSDGFPILERPILNKLYERKSLYSRSGYGRVANQVYFMVEFPYRKCGLLSYLNPREEQLFQRWGAKEIHLTAAWDGKVIWRRFGYQPPEDEFAILGLRYQHWATIHGIEYQEPQNINDFPEEFLKDDCVKLITMYKVLEECI
ncbi:hypothetical protein FJZ31_17060 [Candidatus Poribacteria bacterium]|nr:hypothetical protein [Candidatus Poribacteria bacterium]